VDTGDEATSMEYTEGEEFDSKSVEATTQDVNVVCDAVTGIADNDLDSADDNNKNVQNHVAAEDQKKVTHIQSETSEYQQAMEALDDPACWPEIISADIRVKLVTSKFRRGQMDKYQADASGRKFSSVYFKRKLPNGEVVD